MLLTVCTSRPPPPSLEVRPGVLDTVRIQPCVVYGAATPTDKGGHGKARPVPCELK